MKKDTKLSVYLTSLGVAVISYIVLLLVSNAGLEMPWYIWLIPAMYAGMTSFLASISDLK